MDSIDKINLHLARLGMSGADLERKIGVSNSVYSQWNTKLTKPSKKSLLKAADVLGVDISELMPDLELKKENPAAVSSEVVDEATAELREIWETGDKEEREALLAMARMLKARREK